MAVETEVRVVLVMRVPTLDKKDAEEKAIKAIVDSGAMALVGNFGASIRNSEILNDD